MEILPLLDELRAIAQNGLASTTEPADRERYERLLELASHYYGQVLELPPPEVRQRLFDELGQATPKVSVAGAIFGDDGQILLVRDVADGPWRLPSGWVKPNTTPGDSIVDKVLEETGLEVRPVQVVNVFTRLPGTDDCPQTVVVIVYLCEALGGTLHASRRNPDVRYWHINEAPLWQEQHLFYARSAHGCWRAWTLRTADGVEGEPEENLTGERKLVTIYTDGGCLGTPGPGGYGAVLLTGHQRLEISGGFRLTNNTRMELMAALKALKRLKDPSIVRLYSDSKILVEGMQKRLGQRRGGQDGRRFGYEEGADADLWERLIEACAQHEVTFIWVKGHAGNKENQRCDRLSAQAARSGRLAIDVGFENQIVQRLGLDGLE